MTPAQSKMEPERLAELLPTLPGLDRVREAASGLKAYLVGGTVRDLLLGRQRADIDVAVEGGGVDQLARRLGGTARAHERFATAIVRADDLEVDLVATRSETYARPGALPEVAPAGLLEDLARRDFTVNAMAVPLNAEPELIDPHGGLRDLGRGELRILHDGSFVDDPTRALRAARYSARYGLELEPATAGRLRETDLGTVSRQRVEAELRKLAAEPEARTGFGLLAEWGLFELEPGALDLIGAVSELTGGGRWARIADRGEAILAAALGRGIEEARRLAIAAPARPSQAVELAGRHSGVELTLARALGAEWLDRYASDWRRVRLEIDGDDLLAENIPEGPAIGRGLAAALSAKLDGEVSGRDEELRAALRAARETPPREGANS
jgi:tRNA nucleotidyltransferase (CCA-adding enzyme)